MTELIKIQEQIERRTYLKGSFKGKFIGFLDYRKSDLKHENFYDLEVLSGQIVTTITEFYRWETGEPIKFQPLDRFLTKIPDALPCEVNYTDGTKKHFKINLNEPKLSDYTLSNQIYDGNKIFGDIEGEISGFLKHYSSREVEVPVGGDEFEIIKTNKETGETEQFGNYTRAKKYYSDGGSYWGNWRFQNNSGFEMWEFIVGFIRIALFALILIPIVIAGWQVILPLAIIIGGFYILSIFRPVLIVIWSWFIRLFGLALSVLFIYGMINLIISPIQESSLRNPTNDNSKEVSTRKPEPDGAGEIIISHHRMWQDYDKNSYSGDLEIYTSDFNKSTNYRINVPENIINSFQYNELVSNIYDFDKNKLVRVYKMFDSLRANTNLDEIQFAEIITSCIQDIPYTLILDNACNSSLYEDDFVKTYLKQGGKCEGYIKFGLLSPIEFVGTLKGDCDTRTLLLFTIFNHYNYDVAMFGSELYRHSVIGINLPFNGVSKFVNGKRYVFWETTAPGIKPGLFPPEISDMRFWNVNLISNKQSI